MITKVQELYNKLVEDYEGGLSNKSTAKFNAIKELFCEHYGLSADDVYVTGAGTRPGNLTTRLPQGRQAIIHSQLAVCFMVDDEDTEENRTKLTNSSFVTMTRFVGTGPGSYDSLIVFVVGGTTVYPMGLMSRDTELKDRLQNDFGIDLVNVVSPNNSISNSDLFSVEDEYGKSELTKSKVGYVNIDSRQIIYYGAPGTGKSHKIKSEIKVHSHLRTTFHPDSDYSTFVGAYKPKMEPTLLRDLSGHRVKDEKTGNELWSKQIVYDFVPQAFLKAYLKAWEIYPKKQYLIIEEINRGNCAQIFGDLFQLLDRNSLNFSDYPITADDDLQSYIKDHIKVEHIGEEEIARINEMYSSEYDDVFSAIKKGEMLLLPSNLYIWATMNTSDQSLFPIDSAFKRRWDWKYIPICDAGKGWKIKVDGVEYDWWNFVERINRKIWDATHSEDKKLGYFFCKADEQGVVAADKFVGKVLFYVYNDVFKDYGLDDEIFKDEDGSELLFHKYFNPDGTANEKKIKVLLENMGVKHGDSDNGGEAAKE